MKKLLLHTCLLLLVWISPLSAESQFKQGVLWKISKAGKHSYLLGTMHSDDERVTRLPSVVQQAFEQANSFTAEIKMDAESLFKVGQLMLNPSGNKLDQQLDKKDYQLCVRLMNDRGIPEMALRNMKAWAIAITLSLPKNIGGMVLDMKLYLDAQARGKQLYGLETAEEQMKVFDRLDQQQHVAMLRDVLHQQNNIDVMYKELVDAYLSRDLHRLQQLDEKYMSKEDEALRHFFQHELINKRNQLMFERMRPQLQQGNAFIAVGALHLPGQTGLLQLLHEQGYQLSAIY